MIKFATVMAGNLRQITERKQCVRAPVMEHNKARKS